MALNKNHLESIADDFNESSLRVVESTVDDVRNCLGGEVTLDVALEHLQEVLRTRNSYEVYGNYGNDEEEGDV